MNSTDIANQLGKKGIYSCPNFLSEKALRDLQRDFDALLSDGGFVGPEANEKLRTDKIFTFNREKANYAQKHIWGIVDDIQKSLQQTHLISSFEGHYSYFHEGGYFKKHQDNLNNGQLRVITFVLYFNRDWQSRDGGILRVFAPQGRVEVEPRGGSLVCFYSKDEYEILNCNTDSSCFIGYFKSSP